MTVLVRLRSWAQVGRGIAGPQESPPRKYRESYGRESEQRHTLFSNLLLKRKKLRTVHATLPFKFQKKMPLGPLGQIS